MKETTLKISGMTCSGCSSTVQKIISTLPGIDQASVSLEKSQATVQFDPDKISEQQIISAIEDAGYDIVS